MTSPDQHPAGEGTKPSATPRRFGLDLVRAASALGVAIAHSYFVVGPNLPEGLVFTNALGLLGVEMFFVLSGFLIGGIVLELGERLAAPTGVWTFWRRRWLRTIPNYLLFLVIWTIILACQDGSLPNYPRFLSFTQNLIAPRLGPFPESWSLAIEEWFYLLFPLGVFLGLKSGAGARRAFLLSALVLLVVPAALRFWHVHAHEPTWDLGVRQIVVFRLDAIAWGILAAALRAARPAWWLTLRLPAFWLGATTLWFLSDFYLRGNHDASGFAKTWMFSLLPLGGALLLPLFDQMHVTSDTPLFRSVRALARWSYSLYLVNLPLGTLIHLVVQVPNAKETPGFALLVEGIYLTLCLSLAALVYRFFEKPIMELREDRS